MRLIPVIDLHNSLAVHAVKGERQNYLPVKSVLCGTAEPVAVARAFREHLGLAEVYIADLDAIQGNAMHKHRALISTLVQQEGLSILLDAGVSDPVSAQDLLDLGAHQVIIGAETLPHWDLLQTIPAAIPGDRLVFSLDMRGGRILSRCPELVALSPMNALQALQTAGWKDVILLDLNRVGSGSGVDRRLIARTRAEFPDINVIAGGGIAGIDELKELDGLGVAGVLLATALHNGAITLQHIMDLGFRPTA